jgi:hypothetical protein
LFSLAIDSSDHKSLPCTCVGNESTEFFVAVFAPNATWK